MAECGLQWSHDCFLARNNEVERDGHLGRERRGPLDYGTRQTEGAAHTSARHYETDDGFLEERIGSLACEVWNPKSQVDRGINPA